MKIVDINGKKREVLSIKKVTLQIPDRVNGGIATTKDYVEVVIQGKNRTWTEWYPLEDFQSMNPDLVLDNAN